MIFLNITMEANALVTRLFVVLVEILAQKSVFSNADGRYYEITLDGNLQALLEGIKIEQIAVIFVPVLSRWTYFA
jgi:hypothetical protein